MFKGLFPAHSSKPNIPFFRKLVLRRLVDRLQLGLTSMHTLFCAKAQNCSIYAICIERNFGTDRPRQMLEIDCGSENVYAERWIDGPRTLSPLLL
jgi:hypothetical protein